MHPNVKRGDIVHKQHFDAIKKKNGSLAPGWEVYGECNTALPNTKLRPDWILVNHSEKRAFILDVTTKFAPRHYKKGLQYAAALKAVLNDPSYDVVYLEDYWLNATIH